LFDLISPYSNRVIGCLNVQTRQLNILDFSAKLGILSISGFEKGNLIVEAENEYQFYKISFG
jgi:hypothetical protein